MTRQEFQELRSLIQANAQGLTRNYELLSRIDQEHGDRLTRVAVGQEQLSRGLRAVAEGVTGNADRIDGLEGRFDGLEQRFDRVDRRFDGLEGRLDRFARQFGGP